MKTKQELLREAMIDPDEYASKIIMILMNKYAEQYINAAFLAGVDAATSILSNETDGKIELKTILEEYKNNLFKEE